MKYLLNDLTSGSLMIKSWAQACLAASWIFSSDAVSQPYFMFSLIVAANKTGSCPTTAIWSKKWRWINLLRFKLTDIGKRIRALL